MSHVKIMQKKQLFCNLRIGFHNNFTGHVGILLTKEFSLLTSFVWDTNMATMSIVFCVSWDCVKTNN